VFLHHAGEGIQVLGAGVAGEFGPFASSLPVAGFMVSKVASGAVKAPSIQWPKVALCVAIHAKASALDSGAGP
jgi:hypothetical protein